MQLTFYHCNYFEVIEKVAKLALIYQLLFVS